MNLTHGQSKILNACEFNIISLQNLKKGLIECTKENHQGSWAIAGVIISLSAQLMAVMNEVILKSNLSSNPNARDDLREIQLKFNEFIEDMINHE